MSAQQSSTLGLLINNPSPLPDGSVSNTNILTAAAAGTTQVTATPITAQITVISNNTAANGMILPVPTKGQTFRVIPSLATNAPKIYPPLGGTINFGSANASVAITAQKLAEFVALDNVGNYALQQGA